MAMRITGFRLVRKRLALPKGTAITDVPCEVVTEDCETACAECDTTCVTDCEYAAAGAPRRYTFALDDGMAGGVMRLDYGEPCEWSGNWKTLTQDQDALLFYDVNTWALHSPADGSGAVYESDDFNPLTGGTFTLANAEPGYQLTITVEAACTPTGCPTIDTITTSCCPDPVPKVLYMKFSNPAGACVGSPLIRTFRLDYVVNGSYGGFVLLGTGWWWINGATSVPAMDIPLFTGHPSYSSFIGMACGNPGGPGGVTFYRYKEGTTQRFTGTCSPFLMEHLAATDPGWCNGTYEPSGAVYDVTVSEFA